MPSTDDTRHDEAADRERISRSAAAVYSTMATGAGGQDSGDEQLLQRRMAAFFQQSGGPGSPEIPVFLDRHLRYGKDHGEQGHLETFEDVFQDVVDKDPSLKTAMKLYGRWQGRREQREEEDRDRKADLTAAIVRIEEHLGELTTAVRLLLEERATRGAAESGAEAERGER